VPDTVSSGQARVQARLPITGFAAVAGSLLLGFTGGVALQLQQAALFSSLIYKTMLAAAALAWMLAGFTGMAVARSSAVQAARAWPSAASSGFFTSTVFRCAAMLLALAISAALGFGLTGVRASAFQHTALSPGLEGKDIVVVGRIEAMPQFGEDGLRFRLGVESARLDGQVVRLPPQIYLGWYSGFATRPAKGAAAVQAIAVVDNDSAEPPEFAPQPPAPPAQLQRQPQTLRAGERWQMTVRLKAPHGNSNPHGFDYELWLWEQGLQATGYVRTGVRDAPPAKLGSDWAHPVERARQSVREAIFRRVDNRQMAGVLAALVVGDQNAIERADWDVFRATGVAHLMSISGLHITMFAWAASLVIGWLWRRSVRLTPRLCLWLPASSAGALGGLMLAALYALFSGWGVPAQRTIWMLACVVLLRQNAKQWPWPVVWALAMAVVLLLDPWALLQAGFWLSFVAVGVLFATDSGAHSARAERAAGRFNQENGLSAATDATSSAAASVRSMLREQWIVTLALTPLSLLLFNQVSLVGLLANAVAIPWVTLLVTPLAMLGVVWAPAWDGAAWCVNLLTFFLQWLSNWPLASVSVAAAPLWCAAAGVAGGLLLALRLPWHWRALGVPLMLPVLLWQPLRPTAGEFDILGADIGQGNALLVRTAGHSLVYDSGPRFSRESDAGHRVLVPLLRAMGERIDLLMLSHRDLDHIGGAAALLAMQPQARLLSSIEDSHELQAIRKSSRCVAGDQWTWDGVSFEVLHPPAADYALSAKPNAMSCVLRIASASGIALLAGDIEAAQEIRLADDAEVAGKLKADFLLIPHHGSKTSSSAPFLDAVKPRIALAQAGYRNRFGHPVESVMDRYRERGISIVKSPACGAASWRSDAPESVACQRQQSPRYWHHQPASFP
jgi:competence protein ComEC